MSKNDSGLRQEIATHLEVEDRILFGLTLRQAIIILVGLSLGYTTYAQLGHLGWPLAGTGAHAPQVLCVVAGIIPVICALACALVEIGGRPIEEWALVLARYSALPKRYVWRTRSPLVEVDARAGDGIAARAALVSAVGDDAKVALGVAASLLEEGDDLW